MINYSIPEYSNVPINITLETAQVIADYTRQIDASIYNAVTILILVFIVSYFYMARTNNNFKDGKITIERVQYHNRIISIIMSIGMGAIMFLIFALYIVRFLK